MLIRLGYDLQFEVPEPVAFVTMLQVHPSRECDLLEPDEMEIAPQTHFDTYIDTFGNRCARFKAVAGILQLKGSTLVRVSGDPDPVPRNAAAVPVENLPHETLVYLMNSRYCEVDRLSSIALDLFGNFAPGLERVQAINNWVNSKVVFGYPFARPTKTALDVFTERMGVCRDFQHLAVTFCRALNIPARYATGYLGDIGVPLVLPMDFSAWYEVYLGDRWWTFDARHNRPRIGRVLMAVGRDASDVAITTSFGVANLRYFYVVTDEVKENE
ncbi:MAG: transglutaminase family protein [Alloacidobacterium sp.]|jgi:transglutaminase-like putative cysteine protease